MYKRVLVPLDGSELAETVLPHVVDLGEACAAEIILLRVIAPPGDGTRAVYNALKLEMPVDPRPALVDGMTAAAHPIYREQEMASLQAEALRSLDKAKNLLSEAGLEPRLQVLFGRPADQIVEFALSEQVDLIAMATHGRSGFRRWVFGSVAEKVLRTSALPILLIRPPGADEYFQLPAVDLAF